MATHYGECECGKTVSLMNGDTFNRTTGKKHVCYHDHVYATFATYDEIWYWADWYKTSLRTHKTKSGKWVAKFEDVS